MADAELLRHLLGSRRVGSIHVALGQLDVEADGDGKVTERVEGSDSIPGRALQVMLPEEGLMVTDVSVGHPSANSFPQQAAHTAGAAASAQDAAKS
jgi:hypothetical protein